MKKDNAYANDPHADDAYAYVIKSDQTQWITFLKGYRVSGQTEPAFTIDETNPVTFAENNKSGTYYVVQLNGNPFGLPTGTGSDASYDEDQNTEYMAANAEVQEFVKAALAEATKTGTTIQPAATAIEYNGSDAVKWENLDLGWYLVGSTLGHLVSLDTTNKDVTMMEKNEQPRIDKKVLDGASNTISRTADSATPYTNDNVWVENTDLKIGQTARFRTQVTVQKNGKNYKLHDTMEEGLTFVPNSVKVYAKQAGQNTYATTIYSTITESASTYAVTQRTDATTRLTDGCDFEIEFKDDFIQGLMWDDSFESVVEVEYEAVLNDKAVIVGDTEAYPNTKVPTNIKTSDGQAANPEATNLEDVSHNRIDGRNTNQTLLTYGDKSATVWDNATVETYQFDVVKTMSASGTTYNLLEGAVFELYADNGNGSPETNALAFVADTEENKTYRTPLASENTVTQFTTDASHALKFKGLVPGIYWLKEYAAPNGYNRLSEPIKVTIDDKGTIGVDTPQATVPSTIGIDYSGNSASADVTSANAKATVVTGSGTTTYTSTNNGGVQVINQTGPELPSTGGIGTTIFYIVGGILVAGSAVLLITKRRMLTED